MDLSQLRFSEKKIIESNRITLNILNYNKPKLSFLTFLQNYNKMQNDEKKEINQLFDLEKETHSKIINKNKIISKHLEEYNKFRENILKQNLRDVNQEYMAFFEFNFINELPLSSYSKNIVLKHCKDLQSSGIKIKQKFQKQIKIQIKETSQHGQIMQVVVTFGYLQFNLNILNFVQKSQKFIQPIVQIGMGTFGCIYSYVYDKKKYAIKKVKIKHFNQGSDQIAYQTKSPLFQYCIYKLLSAVKLGLKLSQDVFGFDLLCFQDVICFSMEIGVEPRFQSSQKESNAYKKFIQLEQTLLFLHDFHIVHFDIKPQNILYSTENDRIVFIDFGISDFIQQSQNQMSFSNFKGTFQYCNDEMKRLLLKNQPQLIDIYWSDVCSLKISVNSIIKSSKLSQNFRSWSENYSNHNNSEYIDCFKQQKNQIIFRNFFLEAKLIYLIYQENQGLIEDFLQKQNLDFTNVLPIFLEINPTILHSRIYKVLFRKKIKGLAIFNQIQCLIDQIFENHILKSVIKYDSIKGEFFKKRYKQSNFVNLQLEQQIFRKKLIESIGKFNTQNESLCYFQLLEWLEKINFFIINEKIIKKQTIFETIRICGRKLFENQSDLLSIDVLLLNCLKKIKQDTQVKIESFFQANRKDKNREITENQRMLNELNTQILFRLSKIFYRINEFQLSKDVILCYINFSYNISKFFYSIFQVMKMIFLTANTNSPRIYMAYFQAIYPNNSDIVKQKNFQQVQTYLPYFVGEKQSSFTSKTLIQLTWKVAFFWERANIRQRNLFKICLQVIRIIFIPLKVTFSEFQKLQIEKLNLLKKSISDLIFGLQSDEVEIQEFYHRKLIIDLNQQLAYIGFYLNFQKQISTYYKLLEKKNQKYINDMMYQQNLINLTQCLIKMKLSYDQIWNIIKNVKEQNIFGKVMDVKDTCLWFKTLTLKKNLQTFQQGQKILLSLLQKTIKRGYQIKKLGNRDAFTIHRIYEYYDDIDTNEIKEKYYWKIKQFLLVYEPNTIRFYKNIIQVLNLLPIQTFLKQNFDKQIEFVLKNAEEIEGFRQDQDVFWILKAQYVGLKLGNKKKIQVYRSSYKYLSNFYSFNNVRKYIEAIQIQFQMNKKTLIIDKKIIEQEEKYTQQIMQVINNMEKKGKQNFYLIPGSISFHCFLLETFFKTKSYSIITNYFVKISQFIKQLTQVHNKRHITFYKNITTNFLDSSFFKEKEAEFSRFSLELFINSSIEQISKYFPEILFFYSALLARNRKNIMTLIQYKSIIKILKLIQYTSKKTQKEIQSFLYVLMVGITEQWEIVKRFKSKISLTRKFYYLKCMRHTHFSQFYNFQQKYMLNKKSKFCQSLINKIKTMKNIWK